MKVRIYKPCKTAMQSGQNNVKLWSLDIVEENNSRSIDDATGWISSNDTKNQLRLKFKTKEDAVKYANSCNYDYLVEDPKTSSIQQKSYSSNFTK